MLFVTEGAPLECRGAWHVWRFLDAYLSNCRPVDLVPMRLWRPIRYAYILLLQLRKARKSYHRTWIMAHWREERRDSVTPQESRVATLDWQEDACMCVWEGGGSGAASAIRTRRLLVRRLQR